jgi:hypothetical protein
MYAGMAAFWTTNLFSKIHLHRYLYHNDLVLYSGVLFDASKYKKNGHFWPPIGLMHVFTGCKTPFVAYG